MSEIPQRKTAGVRLAIAGAETLKGSELKDTLEEKGLPFADLKLLGGDEAAGLIEEAGDEATVIQPAAVWQFDGVDITFFAGSTEFTQKHWLQARDSGNEIVDLSYALEDLATLRAPWIEHELGRERKLELLTGPVAIAHPAAIVLALLLLRASKLSAVRSANATILEPASERDREGMDELHHQTLKLLNFQSLPMEVFGTQSAFNMTASLGGEVHPSITEVELRIAAHFLRLVGDALPTPALTVVQAPVFHAHVFSIFIELQEKTTAEALAEALTGEHVKPGSEGSQPCNIDTAGSDDILYSARAADGEGFCFWIFASADNLRIPALQAVEAAREIVAVRPRGKVQ